MPRSSRPGPNQPGWSSTSEISEAHAVGMFLRNLAARAEANSDLAREIQAALTESGLLASNDRPRRERAAKTGQDKRDQAKEPGHPEGGDVTPPIPLDPFRVLRDQGEKGLQDALEPLDLAELRALVRRHRLDPARISARWSQRERVIQLIVTQVRAYAGYGTAFSHV
jgi:hypothetical protein